MSEDNPSAESKPQNRPNVTVVIPGSQSQDNNEIQCEGQRLQSSTNGVLVHKSMPFNAFPEPERAVEVEDDEQHYTESSLKDESYTEDGDTEYDEEDPEDDEEDTEDDEDDTEDDEDDTEDDEETEEDSEEDLRQDSTDELRRFEDITINSGHHQLEPNIVNSQNFDEQQDGFHQLDLPTSADRRPVGASGGQQGTNEIVPNISQNQRVTLCFPNVTYGTEEDLQRSSEDITLIGGIILNTRKAIITINGSSGELSFDILKELGEGIQGVCLKVLDSDTQYEYCAKRVPNENYESNEVKVMIFLIGVEGFPQIYGLVKESSCVYILMEFLPGDDMNAWIQLLERDTDDLRLVLEVFYQLYQRVLTLSTYGISHNDIHEGNFIIDEWGTPQLIDLDQATLNDGQGTKRDVKFTTQCLRRVLDKMKAVNLPRSIKKFLDKGEWDDSVTVEKMIEDLRIILDDRNDELNNIEFDTEELALIDLIDSERAKELGIRQHVIPTQFDTNQEPSESSGQSQEPSGSSGESIDSGTYMFRLG